MCRAPQTHRYARTRRADGKSPRQRGRPNDPADFARPAEIVRRHRRRLLRALRDLAHRPGERAMTYNIIHRTLYEYAAPVAMSHHVARLEPRATSTQAQENFSLKIFPEPTLERSRTDYFGNRSACSACRKSTADSKSSRTAASPSAPKKSPRRKSPRVE